MFSVEEQWVACFPINCGITEWENQSFFNAFHHLPWMQVWLLSWCWHVRFELSPLVLFKKIWKAFDCLMRWVVGICLVTLGGGGEYKIAKLGSQHGPRSEGVLQSHDKELLRKMRGLAWSCCACNYTMRGEGTYGQLPCESLIPGWT